MTGRPRAASVMPRSYVETSQESSYAVDDSIHRAEYFSNAVLEDTYNQAVSSRGRDNELLRHANATIAYTEHRPLVPRSSIKSRRMRASSVPPRTISVQSPRRRVKISSPAQEGVYYRPVVDTEGLRASNPPIRHNLQPRQYYRLATAGSLLATGVTRPSGRGLLSQPFVPEIYEQPVYVPAQTVRRTQPVYVPVQTVRRTQVRRSQSLPPVNRRVIRQSTKGVAYTNAPLPRIYFPDLSIKTRTSLDDSKKGSVNLPHYYACGGDPMHPPVSELRRKLRRTVCRSKGQPNYYRLKDHEVYDQ